MNKFLRRLFANNGVARGVLYACQGALAPIVAALAVWGETPPKNAYVIFGVIASCALGVVNQLRAYLDQHLSKPKDSITQSVTVSTDVTSKQPPVSPG